MTYADAFKVFAEQYIVSIVSFVGETFALMSCIIVMVHFLGIEGKVTRKTFLPPIIFCGIGVALNVVFCIINYLGMQRCWNDPFPGYEISSVDKFVQNTITVLVYVSVFVSALMTFKKRRILYGVIAGIFFLAFEAYVSMAAMYSSVYFTDNPSESVGNILNINSHIGVQACEVVYIAENTVVMLTIFLALYFGMVRQQRIVYIGWKYRIFFIIWELFIVIMPMTPIAEGIIGPEQRQYMGYIIGSIVPIMGVAIPFLIITMVSKRYAVEKTVMQEDYISAELEYINQYKRNQNETRAFRHDIINNLSMLLAMLSDDNYDKAEKHLETLIGNVQDISPKYATGDEMLDCIVGLKASKMEENGIYFSVEGSIDRGLGMKPVDVCSIFANAMDNAIEACDKLSEESEKWIRLELKKTDKFFSIKLSNTMSIDEKIKNLHGYGTQNMKAAISKYDGIEKTDADGGVYTLSIMIPRIE